MTSTQDQVQVQGTFSNETFAKLELMKIETYSGFFQDGGPSAVLENSDKTSFKHSGSPPKGSKVGVAYGGPNGDQWVFAWEVPEPFPAQLPAIKHNKVLGKHVKAGVTIDWQKIEEELDETNESEVNTPYFKATITPMGSKAELVVAYLNLPRD